VTSPPVLHLEGERTPPARLLRDLWSRRSLATMLARKDFHSRYRSAGLGILWSVLLPLFQGAVLAFVFSRFVRVEVGAGESYPVHVITGMVMWGYFTQSLTAGATAIVDQAAVAGKVYFPRLILPAVPALANVVSVAVSVLVAAALAATLASPPGRTAVAAPLAIALLGGLTAVLAAIVAVVHVYFRDIRYLIQASLLVGLYATPIIYPLDAAGDYEWLLVANPVTGCVQLLRFALLGDADRLGPAVASSVAWTVALSVVAVAVYVRHERTAVDRL